MKSDQPESTNLYVNVYFIPLPDPLPMPGKLTIRFHYDDRKTPYVTRVGSDPTDPVDLLLEAPHELDIAVRMWMVPSYALADLMAMSAAVTVAEVVTGKRQHVVAADPAALMAEKDISEPTTLISVAEVAAFTSDPMEGPSEYEILPQNLEEIEIDDLRDPLMRSLNCLQHLVRAYRITTHALVPEPSYQKLRPWILTATRAIDAKGPPKIHTVQYLSHRNLQEAPPPG